MGRGDVEHDSNKVYDEGAGDVEVPDTAHQISSGEYRNAIRSLLHYCLPPFTSENFYLFFWGARKQNNFIILIYHTPAEI